MTAIAVTADPAPPPPTASSSDELAGGRGDNMMDFLPEQKTIKTDSQIHFLQQKKEEKKSEWKWNLMKRE